jgi:hypothetical protein
VVVSNHLGDLEHLVVDQVSKQTIRVVVFWVDFDLGCLLAAVKIRRSLVGRRPRSRLLAGGCLAEVECLARNLAALDGNLHPGSRAVVAF